MSLSRMLSLVWLIFFSTTSFAQNSLQLIDSDQVERLSKHFTIYYEQDTQLTLNQIIDRQDQFIWESQENPNYGFSSTGLWLHTSFSNVTDTKEWVIDLGFTQLDKVDFYLVSDNKVLASSQQGKNRSSQDYRFPTIKAQLPFAKKVDLYVRLESSHSSLIAPIDIQSSQKHTRVNFIDNLLWGLFYGGLLILALYNFVLYFGNKEKSLIAYVGYIFAVMLWQFVWGGHFHLLFSTSVTNWLSNHMDLIFVIIGIGSGIFTYTFLDAKDTAPKSEPLIKINIALLAFLGFLSAFNLLPPLWQNGSVYLVSLVAIICYMVAGFESYFNHFHPARYFIFAWSILASTAVIGMLSLIAVFPSNTFTTYCFQVGVFLEAGLFSLALMDKSRSQLEREIQQATKDLRNNMEFIEEQNVRLDIARKDAIKASHIKSQFLANMSHEIRTPLNAILGFSKELNQLDLPNEKKEHVLIINNAADNLLGIVNDVLDVSKIEAGKLQINNQPFSPNQLLEEMVSVMSKSAHRKKLDFVFELGPLPDKLIGDVIRIKQVLNNLLGNALKFTPHGHISLSATGKELEHDIFELQFKVEDTGIGISQEDRKKLFSAFSQIDDALSRNYQGTGLGLVICQELVKLMGGSMHLTSYPDKGSCFTVTLRTNMLSNHYSYVSNRDWKNKSVLLMSDYQPAYESTSSLLSLLGAKVTSIQTANADQAQNKQYDASFLALSFNQQTSRQSAFDAFQKIRADKKIVLFTGPEPFADQPSLSREFTGQLRLPLTPFKLDNLMRTHKQSEQNELQQRLMQLPKAKVLAVDDIEMNLHLLKTWLKPSALDLTLAFGGAEAVALCEQQEFDLILMDVQMPNVDGLQASQLIRQTELNLGTPIIAVTAHAFKEEQERLLASGMDDYLPKPIDLSELVNLIKRWCLQQEHVPVSLPSLDWDLALKRANFNNQAARELLYEFSAQLPSLIAEIESFWDIQALKEMQASVHKLHGASCYTGVPKLQALCDEIEGSLKVGQIQNVAERVPTLTTEAELVVSETKKHFNDYAGSVDDFDTV